MEFTFDLYPALRLGEWSLRYYSLLYAFSFLTGYFVIRWQIIRGGGTGDDSNHVLYASLFLVWVGGRLGHFVAYEWDVLVQDPMVLFRLSRGGIASHGSTVALFFGYWAFTRFKGWRYVDFLDRMAIPTMWGAFWIRVGNFFNSEIVGRVTDQTWGVRFPRYDRVEDAPLRHPAQLYEAAVIVVVLVILIALDRRFGKEDRPVGLIVGACWISYFGGRFCIEFFKEFQALETGLTMGQWLSFVPMAIGVFWFSSALKNRTKAGLATSAS